MGLVVESRLDNMEVKDVAIKLVDVYKIYRMGDGLEFRALNGISLEIGRGEYVAIMGPSGHGKTTLLNMIGLLDRPTRGKVFIDGVDTSKLDDEELSRFRNEKLGFVFQQYNLINRMTVLENIELPLVIRGIPRSERVRMVIDALEKIGGDRSWLYKRPTQLSGGQQQRVAIARAIVGDPDIILADEPTGNLDTASSRVIMETFQRLNEMGKTIVMVTHAHDIANCANRILLIRDGVIKGEIKPDRSKSIFNIV